MIMKIKRGKEAEALVDKWIHDEHKGILGINYYSVIKDKDIWKVKGEIEIAKGIFSTIRKEFDIKVDSKSGEILLI